VILFTKNNAGFLAAGLIALGALTSCAPGTPVTSLSGVMGPEPYQMSLFELGRGVSDGRVDIYEPGVPTVDLPSYAQETEKPEIKPRDPFPKTRTILVRDPSVVVYSLAMSGVEDDDVVIIEDEHYASPFDLDGNILPP
jgi:hypothetical protein